MSLVNFESVSTIERLQCVFEKIIFHAPENFLNFIPAAELEVELEEKLRNPSGESVEKLEKTVEFILSKCVNTSHTQFVNQLYGGPNPVGLAGSFLIEKMNTNQHTYEVAPVFVVTERIVLRHLRKLFYGHESGDGIFCPGGSFANLYGLIMARHKAFPNIKKTGLFGLKPLQIFVSEESHYSASKMANWMGIGQDNVIKIKTSKEGAMMTESLATAILDCKSNGKMPLAVIATIGTTVLGAFDNLEEIASICEKEKVWLHCDAAWGGSFIFSPKLRTKWLRGIERCDSILWNAHKMLGAPLQCTVFITKESNILAPCNTVVAPYLFQSNKHYDELYDETGDKSVQCGRKSDAFKLWLMWSTLGLEYFQKAIETTEDCARHFTERIRNRDGFVLYLDQHQCTNVYFWYIPIRMRQLERTELWWNQIGEITVKIRTKLLLTNQVMIGYAPLPKKGLPNALRLVLTAFPLKNHENMEFIIESIENVGKEL